jgi:Cu/Ag efflux protein CusF
MPAMTMDYAVKDKALLEKIKKGDQIRFTIQDNAGVVVISEIHQQ